MLVYCGEIKNKYKEDADYYLQTIGLFKLENIAAAINKYYDVVQGYDAIFMPDDDMRLSISSINRLFKIFYQYDLDLAAPTIGLGKMVHLINKTNPRYILRYSNYIDMGCPIFKKQLLLEMLPLFTLNRSGYGIECLWSERCKDKKMALIDHISLVHLKNMAQIEKRDQIYEKMAEELGEDSAHEIASLTSQYKLIGTKKIYGGIKLPLPLYFVK